MFHFTVVSEKEPQEVINTLKENLQAKGFGVLWQVNMEEKIQARDLTINGEYHVLEVCDPLEAHNFLTKNKLIGYFLPCKIAVYKDEGETKVGRAKLTSLLGLAEDESVMESAKNIESQLIDIINETV